jgi:hypothetical protein
MWQESFIKNDTAVLSRADVQHQANAEFLRRAAAMAVSRKHPSGDAHSMYSIRAAFKHYSLRDNCHEHWARAVWRPHCGRWRWQYFGHRSLAVNKRKDYVLGVVWPGELIAQYEFTGLLTGPATVTAALLVLENGLLCPLRFISRRPELRVQLPGGRVLVLPAVRTKWS